MFKFGVSVIFVQALKMNVILISNIWIVIKRYYRIVYVHSFRTHCCLSNFFLHPQKHRLNCFICMSNHRKISQINNKELWHILMENAHHLKYLEAEKINLLCFVCSFKKNEEYLFWKNRKVDPQKGTFKTWTKAAMILLRKGHVILFQSGWIFKKNRLKQ